MQKTVTVLVRCFLLLLLFVVLVFGAKPSSTRATQSATSTSTSSQSLMFQERDSVVQLPLIINSVRPSIYWGAYVSNAPWEMEDLDNFEAMVGKQVAIVHFGFPWKQNGAFKRFPTPQMDVIRDRGSIPMISWGSWHLGEGPEQSDFRLRVITEGRYDNFIASWARAAKEWGHPFFLRFDWEMDGQWQFTWSVQLNGNRVEDYVPAWRHVHDIFTAEGATNVTWVWCPNTVSHKSVPLPPLYPGEEYVDWTCLDGYNFNDAWWLNFAEIFSGHPGNPNDSYQQILEIAPSKPIMIGEFASAEAGDGGSRKAAWIRDALEVQIPENYPQIRAVVWFNWNAEAGSSWAVDSSAASAEAFAEAISLPIYADNLFGDLDEAAIPPLPR